MTSIILEKEKLENNKLNDKIIISAHEKSDDDLIRIYTDHNEAC
jgi:hypothetical protein